MALWTALYSFAPYAGIGVKTTLGMGGVSVMKASIPLDTPHFVIHFG